MELGDLHGLPFSRGMAGITPARRARFFSSPFPARAVFSRNHRQAQARPSRMRSGQAGTTPAHFGPFSRFLKTRTLNSLRFGVKGQGGLYLDKGF